MSDTERPALYERFRRGLALSPDRPALRIGSETHTYRELHEQALTWAGSPDPPRSSASSPARP